MLNTLSKTFTVSIVSLFCSGVQASSILDDYDGDERDVPSYSMECDVGNYGLGRRYDIVDDKLVIDESQEIKIVENNGKVFAALMTHLDGVPIGNFIYIVDYEEMILTTKLGKLVQQYDCV